MACDTFDGIGDKFVEFVRIFLYSLLQAGHCYAVRAKAVVEVVTKFTLMPQLFNRGVCGRDYSSVKVKFFMTSDGRKDSLFENLQQFYLYLGIYISDLIKEY